MTASDKETLAKWLSENVFDEIGSEEELFEVAVRHLKHRRLELASQKEFERLIMQERLLGYSTFPIVTPPETLDIITLPTLKQ